MVEDAEQDDTSEARAAAVVAAAGLVADVVNLLAIHVVCDIKHFVASIMPSNSVTFVASSNS